MDEAEPRPGATTGADGGSPGGGGGAVGVALLGDSVLVREGLAAILSVHPRLRLVESRRTALIDLLLVDPWRSAIRTPGDMAALRTRLGPRQLVCFSWKRPAVARGLAAGLDFDHFLWKEAAPEDLVNSLALAAGVEPLNPAACGPSATSLPHQWGSPGDVEPAAAGEAVLDGPRLSGRELQLLQLIMGGTGNEEISRQLYLSPNTVKSYIRNLYGKLHVGSRAQAVIWGYEHRAWIESLSIRHASRRRLPAQRNVRPR